jgi:hypothetical protein
VDVAAPGGSTATNVSNSTFGNDGVLSTWAATPDKYDIYSTKQGTSFAAAHVAGAVALMRSVNPQLTPQRVDDLLASGRMTIDLGPPGRDDEFGHGLIDANAAVIAAREAEAARRVDDALLFGDRIRIKPGRLLRARVSGPAAPPALEMAPTVFGGRLRIFDTASGGAGETIIDLPPGGWKALGTPPGSRGYRFTGGPCERVSIDTGRIMVACSGSAAALSPPFRGEVGFILELGSQRYCARFGGVDGRNTDRVVIRYGAGISGECPSVENVPEVPNGGSCTVDGECAVGSYCAKPPGHCSDLGECRSRPVTCVLIFAPVCGCDNTSYGNSCSANGHGVNVQHCGQCGDPEERPCTLAGGACDVDEQCTSGTCVDGVCGRPGP